MRPELRCSDTPLPKEQAVVEMKMVCAQKTSHPFMYLFLGAFPSFHIVWGKFPLEK